jgi:hypothetical protein
MADDLHGFDFDDADPVARAVERRIRRAAIRRLDSIDLDDPDDRVDPLPDFSDAPVDPSRSTSG